MVPSKINLCFPCPNWEHLLEILSNYLVGKKLDKHAFYWKEAYFSKFRGVEGCVLIDEIMTCWEGPEWDGWTCVHFSINLPKSEEKICRGRMMNCLIKHVISLVEAKFHPHIFLHTFFPMSCICALWLWGRFRFVFLSVFSSLKTHHLKFLEAI